MIIKKHIQITLCDLNNKYNIALSTNQSDAIYFSKLALLEYCGWIEECFDIVVRRASKGKLKTAAFEKLITEVIDTNYGFQYKQHLRNMLIKTIGLDKTEKIELNLNKNGDITVFTSELSAIKKDRDSAAHTWVKGATKSYPAPSITLGRLQRVYPIIKKLYSEVCKL